MPKDLLLSLGKVFPMGPWEESSELLTYRDTFDLRLLGAGLTLATSRTGRQARVCLMTRKGLRTESVVPKTPRFASDLPPGPPWEALQSIANHRRLLPQAEAEWRSTLVAIVNEKGETVVRLLLREGEALCSNGRERTHLPPRLQFVPLKGHRAEGEKVTSFIRRTFGLERDRRTELAAVRDALGQSQDGYSSSFTLVLDPQITAVEATRRIHRTLLHTMLANREGVARNWDSEFLHDFRVAVRRTRSVLSQLKGIFPAADVDHFSEEFQWLGVKTGPARDIDVYLLNIPRYRAALPPEARDDLEPLVRFLQDRKKIEHERLRRCLRSKRFSRLLEDWQAFLDAAGAPAPDLPKAGRPIREVASEQIWRAFKKVLKKGGRIGRNSSAEALHRLRIDCKKLRYLITFFQSLYPKEALSPLIKELKRLQDHLGDFNDLQMQEKALRSFAEEMMVSDSGPPATLVAMGQLMGQLQGKQIQEREAFYEHLKQFSDSGNRRRFREFFGQGPGDGTEALEEG
ncbi:MAG: CHAD domain-containing protein [Longimicrobiales bacterium]|nr:CHAD domain-containing protein [Longimicrobiales bacterium]